MNNNEIEQSVRETLNSIHTISFSTKADLSEFNFISDAVRTIYGYSPEEIYKNNSQLARSVHPQDFPRFKEFIRKAKSGQDAALDYRIKDRFNKEHWIRHNATPIIKNNEIIRIVGYIHDITEEKIIQIKLERSEERFRLLINTADDLIFILDGFGYFTMVNKSGATVLGYIPGEMIGRHFLEYISKDDEPKIAKAFEKILSTDEITIFETAFIDRYDKEVIFEIHAKPMFVNGEITGMFSIGRNITTRKRDEQKIKELNSKLVEANRIISIERERAKNKITLLEELNQLKSEFISNISHELRTPLASIVGFAETINSDPDLPKEMMNEFTNIILSEGKRLAKLINDVLDFSKLESGEEELKIISIDVIDLIDEIIVSLNSQIIGKKLSITRSFPDDDLVIKADKERMTKVIYNLLSNAIKFTNQGGRISVLAQDFGKEIEIAISDTGIGIPEKEIPKLFQKFSKVNRPGTQITGAGFGLTAVKQIVELHKGLIKVRSEVNKGSTFIVRLPK
ncbi:MAG: PAS domain S-box protein [Melioribacteraceae bacterium]|nr:PAS domain S-box protein [Melioribacteraceae bacterium]